ncbi:bifunctional isocitrate dehydrogenase kinase/phosphatase [Bythopirellula polymerisocia]|uniref:Isocitrate dehydrogenase kinase/phosphatase n=1 Tax=Bythopirellula polymerisocia TaxID=2528003 RepID=A0A5C6CY25_9BACT|nr:bifunctional isocitrate dehydrogenase kinase/phosphatase [Bythopirellula polymerisocia]TWU28391.1 Isocitrate dehydrogenase kinase/phosphatase [Bythopirellula polymerisocia]
MTARMPMSTSRLANGVSRAICDGFADFHSRFRSITQQAAHRFAQRDWRGLQEDTRRRLEVRDLVLAQLLTQVRARLGDRLHSRLIWVGIKAVYSGLIEQRDDWEVAETFFNSVTRRVFTTVGIDPEIEFLHTDYAAPPTQSRKPVFRTYRAETTADLIRKVLSDHPELHLSAHAIDMDAGRVATRLASELKCHGGFTNVVTAMFANAVFYRGEHAYLMGRTTVHDTTIPLVLCLIHDDRGPRVDAVLLTEEDVSLLFSFTRSYFLVEVERPYDMVAFINSLIPHKKVAEIYISMGYNKHGKTELYRNALRHLADTHDNYQLAEGQKGMVMIVFTMPSYPVVIKVIRDNFEFPKDCSRESVINRYHLIFNHDRAGRLVDAQEYEYLVLDRARFSDGLLAELCHDASKTVSIDENRVVIKHCYAERRVTPLNVYLRQADVEAARAAVVDYGQAIKDLALTNLFPGDLLPKNFGVTRNKRVVFYDYDEVCLLTECKFRKIPQSRDYDDEFAAEPWFGVGPHDIFPEEFLQFLGLTPELKQVFSVYHGDLLQADFWNGLKQRLATGELFHVAPYAEDKRLAYALPPERKARTSDTVPESERSITLG